MKINVTYNRRFKDEEQSVDFYTRTFSSSSDDVLVIRIPKKSPNQHIHRTSKYKLLSELSDWKVGPASFHSRRHSSRVCDRTSVLRGPLSDSIFDHYFRNIWKNSAEEKRNQCTYLNCLWFYMYTTEHNRESVLTWIKKENIFLKKYVFVPIVLWYIFLSFLFF
ncbi:hypothetical protein BUALT_Bualt02G0174600 [Buddleja alternifolia]|uniref:Uncharacterized protein n=1 Tax=Buddleja alternifolia TaxID=168488 RepID=A0AAV6Y904_9LAMI|nr:hypothetical protein BUALT_Bualt02G0174600 [Buddleja alternifolia]